MQVAMWQDMTLQLARLPGDGVGQDAATASRRAPLAALEPGAIQRLKPRRAEGPRRLIEAFVRALSARRRARVKVPAQLVEHGRAQRRCRAARETPPDTIGIASAL